MTCTQSVLNQSSTTIWIWLTATTLMLIQFRFHIRFWKFTKMDHHSQLRKTWWHQKNISNLIWTLTSTIRLCALRLRQKPVGLMSCAIPSCQNRKKSSFALATTNDQTSSSQFKPTHREPTTQSSSMLWERTLLPQNNALLVSEVLSSSCLFWWLAFLIQESRLLQRIKFLDRKLDWRKTSLCLQVRTSKESALRVFLDQLSAEDTQSWGCSLSRTHLTQTSTLSVLRCSTYSLLS